MQLSCLTSPNLIVLDESFNNQLEVIECLVDRLFQAGKLHNKKAFLQAVLNREADGPTALGEELAVPHGKSDAVRETAFAVARLATDLSWEGVDGPEPVRLVVMLAVPLSEQKSTHITLLSELTSKLVHAPLREQLLTVSTSEQFIHTLDQPPITADALSISSTPSPFIIAITACPTGIAHTYMAAQSLEACAQQMGIRIRIETQGANGIENRLSDDEIAKANAVIFANDVAIIDADRFTGLPTLQTSVSQPIQNAQVLLQQAIAMSKAPKKTINNPQKNPDIPSSLTLMGQIKQALLTGISHAIPLIATGGILLALSITMVPITAHGPDFTHHPIAHVIKHIGQAAFTLLLPVLAGYIAYGKAGRGALVAGLIGGYLASLEQMGFLGALIAGLMAGFIVSWIQSWPVHAVFKPIMPIIITPVVSTVIVGTMIMVVLGSPIEHLMYELTQWLQSLRGLNAVMLGGLLGAMVAIDVGGPINKTAFFFGAAMIQQGDYLIMGAIATAICVPPLSVGLATKMGRSLWPRQEYEAGTASLLMGMVGITEGAIPFVLADPIRVIPSIVTGSATAAAIAMAYAVGDHAPHGGPIVLPVVDNRLMYIIAISVGTLLAATMMNLLRKYTLSPAEKLTR